MVMPIYEYRCLGCGQQFEKLILPQSPAVVCPACSSESVERLISSFAVNSESKREASTAAARRQNLELNTKQDPDKPRVQIDHPHQH
jgi:putative FmdB family regulatory protein